MGAKAVDGCQCLFLRRKEYRTRQGDWASPQPHPTLQLCPDWFDHLVMEVTWLPKCSLHPQEWLCFEWLSHVLGSPLGGKKKIFKIKER